MFGTNFWLIYLLFSSSENDSNDSSDLLGLMIIMQNILIAWDTGLRTKSWWIGVIVLVIIFTGLLYKATSKYFIFGLSLCYSFIGYKLGVYIDSTAVMVLLSIMGFLFGLGINIGGHKWFQDMAN